MRLVVLYYSISTLVYFYFGTSSLYWHLFNMLSVLFTIAVFMYLFMQGKKYKKEYKDWLIYGIILTVSRGLYSTACPHAPYDWIYTMNKYFAGIFALWLIILIATKLYRSYSISR